MLLADCICTSSIQSFNSVAIGRLQGRKDSDVKRLELVGGVRGETAQDDAVFKAILQDFEGLMRQEAVGNQNAWFLIRPRFGLGIKYTLDPLQADLGFVLSIFGVRIMPVKVAKGGGFT